MAYKYDAEISEEQFSSYLLDAVKKVETETDLDELARLRKIFKKSVPFGRRSYVAAYLAKLLVKSGRGRSRFGTKTEYPLASKEHHESGRFDKGGRFSSERTQISKTEKTDRPEKAPRVQIDDSLATTIFIGIGRNRRVYPRDLVGLLVSVANLSRDRIGDIRVLANYSFIQLFTEDCEKAISALNGYDYRGRKLSVSYSKLSNAEEMKDDAPVESEQSVSDESAAVESAEPKNEVAADSASDVAESATESSASSSYLV